MFDIKADETTLVIREAVFNDRTLSFDECAFRAHKMPDGGIVVQETLVLNPLEEQESLAVLRTLLCDMTNAGYTTLVLAAEALARLYFAGLIVVENREELRVAPHVTTKPYKVVIGHNLFWDDLTARP